MLIRDQSGGSLQIKVATNYLGTFLYQSPGPVKGPRPKSSSTLQTHTCQGLLAGLCIFETLAWLAWHLARSPPDVSSLALARPRKGYCPSRPAGSIGFPAHAIHLHDNPTAEVGLLPTLNRLPFVPAKHPPCAAEHVSASLLFRSVSILPCPTSMDDCKRGHLATRAWASLESNRHASWPSQSTICGCGIPPLKCASHQSSPLRSFRSRYHRSRLWSSNDATRSMCPGERWS